MNLWTLWNCIDFSHSPHTCAATSLYINQLYVSKTAENSAATDKWEKKNGKNINNTQLSDQIYLFCARECSTINRLCSGSTKSNGSIFIGILHAAICYSATSINIFIHVGCGHFIRIAISAYNNSYYCTFHTQTWMVRHLPILWWHLFRYPNLVLFCGYSGWRCHHLRNLHTNQFIIW